MFGFRQLGDRDDERIGGAEREVGVLLDQVGGASHIGGGDGDQLVHTVGHVPQESASARALARLASM
jgi:hypothetical protein